MARAVTKLNMELLFFVVIIAVLFAIYNKLHGTHRAQKAQLFLQLSEKINDNPNFKKIERILDDSESFNFMRLIEDEKDGFDEYLDFFDSLVRMNIPNLFSKQESDMLFARPAELLRRHYLVRKHIAESVYQNLDAVLGSGDEHENKNLSRR